MSNGERLQIRTLDGLVTHRAIHVGIPAGERVGRRGTSPALPLLERMIHVRSLWFDRKEPYLYVDGARYALDAFRSAGPDESELVYSQAPCIVRSCHSRAPSPSGSRFAVTYPPRIVALADAFDEDPPAISLPKSNAFTMAWAADERLIALVHDRTALIVDVEARETVKVLRTPNAHIQMHSLAFHPDGELLALGQSDGAVRVLDTTSWKPVASLADHDTRTPDSDARSIGALAWSPDGRWLVVGNGRRGTVGAAVVYATADLRV